jgi:hypothetical protein
MAKKPRSFYSKLKNALSNNKKIRQIDRPFRTVAEMVNGQRIIATGNVLYGSQHFNISFNLGAENRVLRYKEYEVMDLTEPMCKNALQAYASNATIPDVLTKNSLVIESSDEELKEILEELFFVTLDVNQNLWHWTRKLMKYGDHVLFLKLRDEIGIEDFLETTMYEIDVAMKQDESDGLKKPKKVYTWNRAGLGVTSSGFLRTPPLGTNKEGFANGKTNYNKETEFEREEFEQFEVLHFSILGDPSYYPWGKALLETARFAWKQYRIMLDSMLVYRVARSSEKRVFNIEIGNMEQSMVKNYLADQMENIKRVPLVDKDTGDINLQYHAMSHIEDFVLPKRGGQGSTIETLPAGQNTDAVADVELMQSRFRMALEVPKAYLEYDENLATARGLAMEDQRFSANVQRVQQILINEMYKAAAIHLYILGYSDEDLDNFTLSLINPSTQYEKDKLEIVGNRVDIVNNMLSNNLASSDYYMREILKLSSEDIAKIKTQQLEDAKWKFILAQIEANGNYNNMFPDVPVENAGGEEGKENMLGGAGGGGSFGGISSGGGMGGDMGGGLEVPGGELGGEGNGDLAGDIEGAEGGFEIGGGNEAPASGAEVPAGQEAPTGGAEEAGYDALRMIASNDLITKDSKNKNESLNLSSEGLIKNKRSKKGIENVIENKVKKIQRKRKK